MKHVVYPVFFLLLLVGNLSAGDAPSYIELGNGKEAVRFVAFSPDGKKIVTTNIEYIAKIWDADTGKELQKLDAEVGNNEGAYEGQYSSKLTSSAFSPDGKKIVTSSWDTIARIWDVETGKELQTLKGHSAQVRSVNFSPDGKNIVTAAHDGTARIWDAESGKELQKLVHSRAIGDTVVPWIRASAAFSPDGGKIVTHIRNPDNIIRIWDSDTGKKLHDLRGLQNQTGNVVSAFFSPDSKRVISVGGFDTEYPVRIWDTES